MNIDKILIKGIIKNSAYGVVLGFRQKWQNIKIQVGLDNVSLIKKINGNILTKITNKVKSLFTFYCVAFAQSKLSNFYMNTGKQSGKI